MASLWIARHDPLLRFDLQERELWAEASHEQKLDELEQQLNQVQILYIRLHPWLIDVSQNTFHKSSQNAP